MQTDLVRFNGESHPIENFLELMRDGVLGSSVTVVITRRGDGREMFLDYEVTATDVDIQLALALLINQKAKNLK